MPMGCRGSANGDDPRMLDRLKWITAAIVGLPIYYARRFLRFR